MCCLTLAPRSNYPDQATLSFQAMHFLFLLCNSQLQGTLVRSTVVPAFRRKIRYLTFFLDRATRFEKSGFTEKEIKVACQVPISGCKATTTKHGCLFFLYHHPSRASEAGSKYPLLGSHGNGKNHLRPPPRNKSRPNVP